MILELGWRRRWISRTARHRGNCTNTVPDYPGTYTGTWMPGPGTSSCCIIWLLARDIKNGARDPLNNSGFWQHPAVAGGTSQPTGETDTEYALHGSVQQPTACVTQWEIVSIRDYDVSPLRGLEWWFKVSFRQYSLFIHSWPSRWS